MRSIVYMALHPRPKRSTKNYQKGVQKASCSGRISMQPQGFYSGDLELIPLSRELIVLVHFPQHSYTNSTQANVSNFIQCYTVGECRSLLQHLPSIYEHLQSVPS